VNEVDGRIRFGSCKQSPSRLLTEITNFKNHVARFLNENRTYQKWKVEYVGIAPRLTKDEQKVLTRADIIPQPLNEMISGL
jgi:hypothetical protein